MLGVGNSAMAIAARHPPFTPARLFDGGVQGLVLDTFERTAIFQDSAGRAAAAPGGDPVGLVLDTSKRLERGAEMWGVPSVTSSAIWKEANGIYSKDSTGSAELGLTTLSASQWYEVVFTIIAASGVLYLWRRGQGGINEQAASNLGAGTHRLVVQAGPTTNDHGHFLWINGAGFTGTLTNISFRPLPGNHVLAPSAAARPPLRADGTIGDDGEEDALIAPLTGVFSAYIAAGGALTAAENVVMAEDYNILRDGLTGAVIVSGTLTAAQQQELAFYWGVAL